VDILPGASNRVPITHGAGSDGVTTSIMVKIIIKNHGRAPAWVTQMFQGFRLLADIPATLDFEPDLTNSAAYSIPIAPQQSYEKTCTLVSSGWKEFHKESIVYGIVRYRDTFGEDRRTTYGYYISNTGRLDRMTDRPEYNKST